MKNHDLILKVRKEKNADRYQGKTVLIGGNLSQDYTGMGASYSKVKFVLFNDATGTH